MLEPIVLACLLTAGMWLPYLGATALIKGAPAVLAGDPVARIAQIQNPLPDWVNRLRQAHANAVENLAAFVGVCVAATWTGEVPGTVVTAGFAYSAARAAHYVFYGISIPFLRTAAFMVSWLSIFYIGFFSLGWF